MSSPPHSGTHSPGGSGSIRKDKPDEQHLEYLPHEERTAADIEASINPLSSLPKERVLEQADAFVRQFGFEDHADTFRKGALVAAHPRRFETISELSPEDVESLCYERDHKWRLPFMLYFTTIVNAIGAATQGWDQTGSNGANLSFPEEFGIGTPWGKPGGARDEWIVGFVNSAPYIAAALCGCWLSDPLNKYFGRRGEIFITAIVLIATPIASGFTKNWQQLVVVRLILGLALGAKASTVPMYSAEITPANVRGALTMGWQLWTGVGIFCGYCANAIVKDTGKIAWRLQLGSAFIPAVPLAIFIFFCPESPRWYMKKGRMPDAWNSMRRLRNTELQAARDLFYAHVLYSQELEIKQGANYISRFTELFTIPRCRRATLAASVVMLAQQMCGINIMAFYSSSIFVEGGFSQTEALYASIGCGAMFVFCVPAMFMIDKYGRRTLLLATFPNMCWTLLGAALCYLIHPIKLRIGLVALFVYLFIMLYNLGEGPVPFMYSAEVFPLPQREQGMAFSVAWNNGWASVLALTFPRLLRALGSTGTFGFYAGLNAVAFVWIFLWMPETKLLTLEELDAVFSIPTSTYSKYQVTQVAPYWFKRYVLRQNVVLEPLRSEKHGMVVA